MKKNLFACLLTIVTIYGCTKEDDENISAGNPVNSQKAFSAMMDGVLFETDSAYGLFQLDSSMHLRWISVSGYIGDEYIIAMQVDTIITEFIDLPNTPSGWGGPIIGYEDESDSVYYSSETANMAFTAHDTLQNLFSGTFSGFVIDSETSDTIHITNGRFTNVYYEFDDGN